MKKAFFVFVCVFLLSACTSPAMSPESSNDSPLQDKAPQQTEDHLGCQEGEVINGKEVESVFCQNQKKSLGEEVLEESILQWTLRRRRSH
jgi:uncharacterized protein YcfL